MDYESITKSLAAIGAGFGAIGASWKWLPKAVALLRAKGMVAGLKKLHAIHNEMERAIDFGAARVVIFGGHNSGGVPRAGSPFYVSALHCHIEEDHIDKTAAYQAINVDSAYIALLLRVVEQGYARFDCSSAAAESMLLRFYRAEGVVDSLICYLGTTDGNLIYVSFSRFAGAFSANEETELRLVANNLAQHLK